MRNLNIEFGAFADPIIEQIGEEDISCRRELQIIQEDANAITRLSVRGLIGERLTINLRKKITKKIKKYLT